MDLFGDDSIVPVSRQRRDQRRLFRNAPQTQVSRVAVASLTRQSEFELSRHTLIPVCSARRAPSTSHGTHPHVRAVSKHNTIQREHSTNTTGANRVGARSPRERRTLSERKAEPCPGRTRPAGRSRQEQRGAAPPSVSPRGPAPPLSPTACWRNAAAVAAAGRLTLP